MALKGGEKIQTSIVFYYSILKVSIIIVQCTVHIRNCSGWGVGNNNIPPKQQTPLNRGIHSSLLTACSSLHSTPHYMLPLLHLVKAYIIILIFSIVQLMDQLDIHNGVSLQQFGYTGMQCTHLCIKQCFRCTLVIIELLSLTVKSTITDPYWCSLTENRD